MKIRKIDAILEDNCNWASKVFRTANEAWEYLYLGLNKEGDINSPRGIKVKETLGCNIYITNPCLNLIFNSFRGLNPVYLAKEYFWYKSGDRSVKEAKKLSKFWETIANNDGTVNSNYGAYIFVPEEDGKTVWEKTVDILKKDSDSRQSIIQIPIMPSRGSKDTPCTSSIQFAIRNGKLNTIVYMRSTDIILGFPIDIFQFTMWQIEMARELGVQVGWMRFISGNLHCYEKNWIENVGREFSFEKITDISENERSDHNSFQKDLILLKKFGDKKCKEEELISGLTSVVLKEMFKNRKIWK